MLILFYTVLVIQHKYSKVYEENECINFVPSDVTLFGYEQFMFKIKFSASDYSRKCDIDKEYINYKNIHTHSVVNRKNLS